MENILVIMSIHQGNSIDIFVIQFIIINIFILILIQVFPLRKLSTISKVVSVIYRSVDMCLSMSSVLTLLAITIDRFLILSKPLNYPQYRTGKIIALGISIVWGFAILSMGLVVAVDYIRSAWIGFLIPVVGIVPLLKIFVLWIMIARIALRAQNRLPQFRYSIGARVNKSKRESSSVKNIGIKLKTVQTQNHSPQIKYNETNLSVNKLTKSSRSLCLTRAKENRGLKMAALIIGYDL